MRKFVVLFLLISVLMTGLVSVSAQDFDLESRLDAYLSNELPAGWGMVNSADLSIELLENPIFLLDVRSAEEWNTDGYIEGATLVPVKALAQNLDLLPADLDTPIVVYCKAGTRGTFGMITLQVMGYTNVRNLSGGLMAWVEAGMPVGNTPAEEMEFATGDGPELDEALVAAMDDFLTNNIPAGWGQVAVADFAVQSMETEYFLLDVRTPEEWAADGIIEGAALITLKELGKNFDALPTDMPIMVYCKAGTRGNFGAIMLQMLGFEAYNLSGGIMGWIEAGYDVVFPEAAEFDLATRLDEYLSNELPAGWGMVNSADLSMELLENPIFLLDVRSAEEWNTDGYIEGATLVPVKALAQNLDLLPADLDTPIVVYCKAGTRGAFGMITLQVMGYTNVRNLSGGLMAWVEAGMPVGDTPAEEMEFATGDGPELDEALVAAMDDFLTNNIPAGWGQVAVADFAVQSMETEYFLLDVRTAEEWASDGIIEGAALVTLKELGKNFDALPTDMPIVVYCKAGTRGMFGMIALQMMGFEAYNLSGGIMGWIEAGYPVVPPS